MSHIRGRIRSAEENCAKAVNLLRASTGSDTIEQVQRMLNEHKTLFSDLCKGDYETTGCTCETYQDDDRWRHIPDEKCKHHGHLVKLYDERCKKLDEYEKRFKEPYRFELFKRLLAESSSKQEFGDDRIDGILKLVDLAIEKFTSHGIQK